MKLETYPKNPFLYIHKQLKAVNSLADSEKLPEAERQTVSRKRKLLLVITEYMRQGDWCSSAKAQERLYSLAVKGYTKTCEEYGIGRCGLVNMALRHAEAFCCKIGFSFAYMLENDKVEEAAEVFAVLTNFKGFQLFTSDIREVLPEPEDVPDLAFEDMDAELRFLHSYCSRRIRQRVRMLDEKSLALLMYIIEGADSRYTAEQGLLISFLSKRECDIDGLFSEIRKLII